MKKNNWGNYWVVGIPFLGTGIAFLIAWLCGAGVSFMTLGCVFIVLSAAFIAVGIKNKKGK